MRMRSTLLTQPRIRSWLIPLDAASFSRPIRDEPADRRSSVLTIPTATSFSAYVGPIPSTSMTATCGEVATGPAGAAGADARPPMTDAGPAAAGSTGSMAATAVAARTAAAAGAVETAGADAGGVSERKAVVGAVSAGPISAGAISSGAVSRPNASLTSDVVKYQRMTAGMIAIDRPIPLPGNWKNAIIASISPNPAMTIAKRRAHGWSDHRPRAAISHTAPVMTASQPHSPTRSKLGRSPRTPNQSNPI